MSSQPFLQLLPLTSTEVIPPSQLVVPLFRCRAGLICEFIHDFSKRALYLLQWPIQLFHMVERPFIFLNGLANITFLYRLL